MPEMGDAWCRQYMATGTCPRGEAWKLIHGDARFLEEVLKKGGTIAIDRAEGARGSK